MRRFVFALLALFAVALPAGAQPFLRVSYVPPAANAQLTWTQVPGAASYTVRRASTYPNWTNVGSTSGLTTSAAVSANSAYVFQVVALNGSGQQLATSNPALVTTHAFSSEPLVQIRAQFLAELRTMVDAARGAAGVAAMSWTRPVPAVGTPLYKEYWSELRTGIDTALQQLGYTPSAYTDPVLSSSVGIRKVQVEELRARIRSYPEWVTLASWTQPQLHFSPNGDGVKDTTTMSAQMTSTSSVRWWLNIVNASSVVVRSTGDVGNSVAYTWDGRDSGAVVQPDGAYRFDLIDRETSSVIGSATVVLDNTLPLADIVSPAQNAVLSNIRQNGATVVSVTGRATDANFTQWQLQRVGGGQSTVTLASGTSPVSPGSTLLWWETATTPGASYDLRLTVHDAAGNQAILNRAVQVGHFTASQNFNQMSVADGESITYSWSVPPFPITGNLLISDNTGATVRTHQLVPGQNSFVWNGSRDGGGTVGNGTYIYKIVVSDGTATYTWNDFSPRSGSSTQFPYPYCRNTAGTFVACNSTGFDFDPYTNKPLRIGFCVGSDQNPPCSATAHRQTGGVPALVTVKVSSGTETTAWCDLDCISYEFRASGFNELVWYGQNLGSDYVANKPYLTAIRQSDQVPRNLTVVHRSTPTINSMTFTPYVFNPSYQVQRYTIDVTTGGAATITLELRNSLSGSILRTITQSIAGSGIHIIDWDGKSGSFGNEGPMFVTPGLYEATITVREAGGGQARITPLTHVQY